MAVWPVLIVWLMWITPVDVDSTWLPNGHKYSWFDCHRRFLPPDHTFRGQKNAFRKGVAVFDMAPHRLTGEEVAVNILFTSYIRT